RRDVLLALFWPELDEEHARNALSQAVHFLRRSLGEHTVIAANGDELGLASGAIWCDAAAFEEAIADGREAEALELYRGDLLQGFHIANAPDFERWLTAERSRLADKYFAAAQSVARQRESAGDHKGALALWKHLTARDPYDAHLTIRYMRSLALSGDRAAAIRHARVYDALVREELNAEPDARVSALVNDLQTSPPESGDARDRPATERETQVVHTPVSPAGAVDAASVANHRSKKRPFISRAVFAVLVVAAIGSAVALRNARGSAATTIRSLAVLPFEDLSSDSTKTFFAEGMHEALITELARYPEISVISRTSVASYRSTKKSLPEIARELNVDGVVEGGVVRDGGRVRMTARLVHAASDHEIWAQRYDRDLRDVLVLQTELAEAIARELQLATHPVARKSRTAVAPSGTPPRELYLRELILRGRHAELSRSLVGVETAKEAYRLAVNEDSTYAPGWAGLAGVYGFLADYSYRPFEPTLDSARMMARRAVALDSTLPEARVALAVTLGDAHDFAGAEREFRRAIELSPSNARAHYWYSILLVALGRGEEALSEANRSLSLDPFSPRGATAMKRYATFLITGEYPHLKQPIEQRRPILKLEPGEPWARAREADDFAQAGRCKEANAAIAMARQGAPGDNFRMLAWVTRVYWYCGERDKARALLARMKTLPRAEENGYRMALAHTAFGETDSAFVWLDRERWTMPELAALSADFALHDLRADPRYPAMLRRLKLRPA
ncbi:MAG TPA: tetratricopeptide repeat protein, partial [Gemmatimonadaceae bacterium]|nr:tetratricopeptide repeat protein [Gemmatimonadaceae bacterium]